MTNKDKTEADPLARWQTVRLTGADILKDMNSLPVDVSKIEFVQATDFDRLAARVETLEAENSKLRAALKQIALGDGYYGAQAKEYKEIARKALGGEE